MNDPEQTSLENDQRGRPERAADRTIPQTGRPVPSSAADPTLVVADSQSGLPESGQGQLCGAEIGRYLLTERIGVGGFGEVYLAKQSEPIRRSVALKVLKPGVDTDAIVRRFAAERQALALMDHRDIAKVFDAGVTALGRPYFVMELVHGEPITAFCDSRNLDIRERIALFIRVCLAIDHAHTRQIVHRDIKPSNILVGLQDGIPAPKVIDFGIAKALGEALTDAPVLTKEYEVLGTPRYMSPEQTGLVGMAVDHRTDLYSLGVVLYELIAGEPPFLNDTEKVGTIMGWMTVICQQEPQRPSTAVLEKGESAKSIAQMRRVEEVHDLSRLLREDLDWIALRCLEKAREDRYQSAADLAEDLRRFLAHQPVSASRPSLLYQARKMLRRRRDAVRAGLIFAGVLLTVLIGAFVVIRNTQYERRIATHQEDLETADSLFNRQPQLPILPIPRRCEEMKTWLREADVLLSRKQDAVAAVAELSSMIQSRDVRDQGERSSADTAFRLEQAQRLVNVLSRLENPNGPYVQVQGWLQRTPSPEESAKLWIDADRHIAERYSGLVVGNRSTLVPIGTDPVSGLWEFTDLQQGLVPLRDAVGSARPDAYCGLVYVLLPGGTFQMGSPPSESGRKADEHQHSVTVGPFLISRFEVLHSQWIRAMKLPPQGDSGDLVPAAGISWQNAAEFCRLEDCQLPSEAQWEYACRAGSAERFSGSDVIDDVGWCEHNSGETRHPVGLLRPNAFGLHDMHGNVIEWCLDVYSDTWYSRPEAAGPDPVCLPPASPDDPDRLNVRRVLRGGGFDGREQYCRSADRYREVPTLIHISFGLRPVRPVSAFQHSN